METRRRPLDPPVAIRQATLPQGPSFTPRKSRSALEAAPAKTGTKRAVAGGRSRIAGVARKEPSGIVRGPMRRSLPGPRRTLPGGLRLPGEVPPSSPEALRLRLEQRRQGRVPATNLQCRSDCLPASGGGDRCGALLDGCDCHTIDTPEGKAACGLSRVPGQEYPNRSLPQ